MVPDNKYGLNMISQRHYERMLRRDLKIVLRTPQTGLSPSDPHERVVMCLCRSNHTDRSLLGCVWCGTWQHEDCYYPQDTFKSEEEFHDCVNCNPRYVSTCARETITIDSSHSGILSAITRVDDVKRAKALNIWNHNVAIFDFGLNKTQLKESNDSQLPLKMIASVQLSEYGLPIGSDLTWARLKTLEQSMVDSPKARLRIRSFEQYGLLDLLQSLQILHYYATQPICGIRADLINAFFENLLYIDQEPLS